MGKLLLCYVKTMKERNDKALINEDYGTQVAYFRKRCSQRVGYFINVVFLLVARVVHGWEEPQYELCGVAQGLCALTVRAALVNKFYEGTQA